MSELNPKTTLVSAHGGILDYVEKKTGEVLFSVGVPAGRFSAGEYLDLCPEGVEVQIAEGLVAVQPKGGYALQQPHNLTDSGANPDYHPTSADRLQRQMQHNISVMASNQKALEAKVRALAAVERVPTAPAQPPADPQGEAAVVE